MCYRYSQMLLVKYFDACLDWAWTNIINSWYSVILKTVILCVRSLSQCLTHVRVQCQSSFDHCSVVSTHATHWQWEYSLSEPWGPFIECMPVEQRFAQVLSVYSKWCTCHQMLLCPSAKPTQSQKIIMTRVLTHWPALLYSGTNQLLSAICLP